MKRTITISIIPIIVAGLLLIFLGCGKSVSPVPRSESYGGEEPAYELTEDEAELLDILDMAYRRRTGRSLQVDGWLQLSARRMNWLLQKRGYGFSSKELYHQVVGDDSVTGGIVAPDAVPLASEAQRSGWVVGSTAAYPFVFTGLSAGFMDEFDADRLSWDDILGFGCNVVGVGVRKQLFPPGRWVTFLFAEQAAILDEFPKIVDPDSIYYFSGVLLPGYLDPGLLVTTPWGEVNQFELDYDMSGEFFAEISFESGPGEYLLEMTCESVNGPRVAALFPVSAGGRYPESYSLYLNSGYQVYEDPGKAEEVMVNLVNRDRARFRLSNIKHNKTLSKIARQYSEEMRDQRFLAHVSPGGQDLMARLADMGILYQRALENVSVGYSISGVQAGLMNSPGHRRNILDPEVNQIGVGVAWTDSEDPPRAYVTQLFVKMFEKLDPVNDPLRVLTDINKRRNAIGVLPLQTNTQAAWLAKEHCRSLVEGEVSGSDEGAVNDILGRFQDSGITFTKAVAIVKQVGSVDQILEADVLFDSTYYWIGMGLCQGESHDEMASWIWTTILLFRDE